MKNKVKFYWKHREAIVGIAIILIALVGVLALIEALINQI